MHNSISRVGIKNASEESVGNIWGKCYYGDSNEYDPEFTFSQHNEKLPIDLRLK